MTTPRLGLAALTVLDTAPIPQIDLAERHGFDTIGIRLLPAAPGTTAYPVHQDRRALADLRRRLDDSSVTLFDIEIIRLAADFDVNAFEPMLAAGAELGAKAVLVGGDDPDRARLTDSYARLAQACAAHGLVASLEFMPWTAVPDARAAIDIVSHADGPARSVLIDALHVDRSATTLDDLAAIPRDWLHYAQLCDGRMPRPTDDAELIRQAREERLPAREGGIDLAGIWATLPADLPVSIELPNEPRRRAVGTDAWLEHLVSTARDTVDSVGAEQLSAH
ncbi:TIM barrel protein [Gordonia sp. CPCC 205515]|uniref:sugar phosphate isomerase/epimerase family protein n=1 Tax=Gordonia sp. CPCC 205515 TaxID=3140791 RepID=UPI003AF3E011